MSNPFFSAFSTLHQTCPFTQIETAHFLPAFEKGLTEAKADIEKISSNPEPASFENTIEALEFSGSLLSRVSSVFFNLNSAETSDEIQQIAQEISPKLSAHANDLSLNKALFQRIKSLFEQKDTLDLTVEQSQLLEKNYKSFTRNGANLSVPDQETLRQIDQSLAKLKLQFGEHVLAANNAFELLVSDEHQLKGLPKFALDTAKSLAESKGKSGYMFTLDYPSYIPFMTYCENRTLRKELSLAFGSKAYKDERFSNESLVLEIAQLRFDRAKLLGYESHSAFVLEPRMAEKTETVLDFLADLEAKSKPFAQQEFKELSAFAKEQDGIENLQAWDAAFYTEKLKKQRFNFDEEELKPYLELEACLDGVFQVASKLFGLRFVKNETIEVYHPDVQAFEVFDEDQRFISVFYADFFPRAGKRGGAWMTSFKDQWQKEGENSRPHISIVCNFTPPNQNTPSLLTFNELTTLFHEFGHALHGMLANTTYPSLSGTNVSWDFVELPSQWLENWCYEKTCLDLFAKHYQSKTAIPMDLVEKIKASSSFMEGMKTLRQVSLAQLDMTWHAGNPNQFKTLEEAEERAYANTRLYPKNDETCTSTAFSHIFQGGYSSGYYSYKWAEVLDADAFEAFKEQGVFNQELAQEFRTHILEKGGTENPMELYKRFRKKMPTNDALLKRAGLLS
ncbi:MAG: M3 family metallopeptidase [Flavobacteriales bacterium]